MPPPKFPFLMPVWSNRVGILRPDQSDGKPAPWAACGIRLTINYNQDADEASWGGFEYLLGNLSDDFYGWVSEAELVKREYPASADAELSIPPIRARVDLAALDRIKAALADDAVPLEEHPDLPEDVIGTKPQDVPYLLTKEELAIVPKSWLIDEALRLRGILDEAWIASGLLGSRMTGQPYQAWEEPTDLIGQIEELASDADCWREHESESST